MAKLPQVKSKEVIKALQKLGFRIIRKSGSHLRLKHPDGRVITVSVHTKNLFKGTLRAILRQAKISQEDSRRIFDILIFAFKSLFFQFSPRNNS